MFSRLLPLLAVTSLVACSKDPAKIIEAKSMAVCGCETIKCVQKVTSDFSQLESKVDLSQVTPEQRERASVASEKLALCVKRIAKTDPAAP
ncbi:MAG: hypothetical protein ACON3Z_19645 [Bradymonadia bacterium]